MDTCSNYSVHFLPSACDLRFLGVGVLVAFPTQDLQRSQDLDVTDGFHSPDPTL
jgi:hypothetical protein